MLPVAQLAQRDAEAWYRSAASSRPRDAARARTAYARALALAPAHADAHLNLGCLDHEAGRLAEAEAHYRAALAARAGDATARFDLAVALEDQQRVDEAREAYLACLADDPAYAEAHYNLARLCERAGDLAAALRHLMAYRRLVRCGTTGETRHLGHRAKRRSRGSRGKPRKAGCTRPTTVAARERLEQPRARRGERERDQQRGGEQRADAEHLHGIRVDQPASEIGVERGATERPRARGDREHRQRHARDARDQVKRRDHAQRIGGAQCDDQRSHA